MSKRNVHAVAAWNRKGGPHEDRRPSLRARVALAEESDALISYAVSIAEQLADEEHGAINQRSIDSSLKASHTMAQVFGVGDPVPPLAWAEVLRVLEFGAEKYRGRSIEERGAADERTALVHYEAAERHLLAYECDERADAETGRHPLAHAAARLLLVLERRLRGLP